MLVSSKKIEKMLRDRDRLERMAKIEYQEAKDLFSVGNMEFAIELQLANQHLGASREITRTLKNIYCIVSNWKHFMCFKRKCCNCM